LSRITRQFRRVVLLTAEVLIAVGMPVAGHPRAQQDVAFRCMESVDTRDKNDIAWLNGWPARPPADASTSPSRMKPHSSGPMWIATPSLQWTCTTYSMPIYPAHPQFDCRRKC
jgi:hypothetical protein